MVVSVGRAARRSRICMSEARGIPLFPNSSNCKGRVSFRKNEQSWGVDMNEKLESEASILEATCSMRFTTGVDGGRFKV